MNRWRHHSCLALAASLLAGCTSKDLLEGLPDAGPGPRSWGQAETLEGWSGRSPELGFDGDGNAIAVWAQGTEIWYGRYEPGSGWVAGDMLGFGLGLGDMTPQIAVNDSGSALAIWNDEDQGLWSQLYRPGDGWMDTELQHTTVESVLGAHAVAMDADGNGIMVWRKRSGTDFPYTYEVSTRRYDADSGWGSFEQLDAVGTEGGAAPPSIGIDDAGNAIAVWGNDAGTVRSSRYTPGAGWANPTSIGQASDASGLTLDLAVSGNGDAVAMWASSTEISAARYQAGSGWGAVETVAAGSGSSTPQGLHVGLDAAGNAIATWLDYPDAPQASRFAAGEGWSEPVVIFPEASSPYSGLPALTVSSAGDAVAIWTEGDYNDVPAYVWANSYQVGAGWGTAENIAASTAAPVGSWPGVASAPNGDALVMWLQPPGLWTNWFRPQAP